EFLLGKKIYLDLWVKALKDWRERETYIRRIAIPFKE
ncbi:GTPase Era, partial [Candidatus Pacearchaeota archaeon]